MITRVIILHQSPCKTLHLEANLIHSKICNHQTSFDSLKVNRKNLLQFGVFFKGSILHFLHNMIPKNWIHCIYKTTLPHTDLS